MDWCVLIRKRATCPEDCIVLRVLMLSLNWEVFQLLRTWAYREDEVGQFTGSL